MLCLPQLIFALAFLLLLNGCASSIERTAVRPSLPPLGKSQEELQREYAVEKSVYLARTAGLDARRIKDRPHMKAAGGRVYADSIEAGGKAKGRIYYERDGDPNVTDPWSPVRAYADASVYNATTGELRIEGSPIIECTNVVVYATSPTTVMSCTAATLRTTGPHSTITRE